MAMQGAAPLVRAAYVALAARFGAPTAPARPATLERGEVCALSGMLAGPDCPHKHEIFARGNAPRQPCTWHRRACGRREVEYPPELEGWARASTVCVQARRSTALKTARRAGRARAGDHVSRRTARASCSTRSARRSAQRPPLRAMPARAPIQWTVDGIAAEHFVPAQVRT